MKNKINTYEILKDLIFDVAGSILYGAGIYSFAYAGNFAPGGISGLSIIINHYINSLPIGLCSLLLNIPILLFTYKTLGKKFLAKSLVSMVIVSLTLDYVFPYVPTYSGSQLLAALFAGSLSGIGLSLIYMRGSSTGGTDFIILSMRELNPHLSIGNITMVIDGSIILLNGVAFGNIEAVLYGTVLTYASTFFIDKLMYKVTARKNVNIITTKGMEIANAIGEKVGRGVTLSKVIGTYTGMERNLLICVCSSSETSQIKSIVYSIDSDAMIMVSTSDEVYGYGFAEY